MRHRDSGRKFNRNSSNRKAMFRNMTASLIAHERIRTTVPKAKSLRSFAEPLITLGKNDTVANRRLAFARLRDHDAVGKLFVTLGKRYRDRPGGYLRILKIGLRPGDRAPMALVELVNRPEGHSITPYIERAQRLEQWSLKGVEGSQDGEPDIAKDRTQEKAPPEAVQTASSASAEAEQSSATIEEASQQGPQKKSWFSRVFKGDAKADKNKNTNKSEDKNEDKKDE